MSSRCNTNDINVCRGWYPGVTQTTSASAVVAMQVQHKRPQCVPLLPIMQATTLTTRMCAVLVVQARHKRHFSVLETAFVFERLHELRT